MSPVFEDEYHASYNCFFLLEESITCNYEYVVVFIAKLYFYHQHSFDVKQFFAGEEFKDHPKKLQGNNDFLCITRPDIVYDVHKVGISLLSILTCSAKSSGCLPLFAPAVSLDPYHILSF